jgi:hypothetical protein
VDKKVELTGRRKIGTGGERLRRQRTEKEKIDNQSGMIIG